VTTRTPRSRDTTWWCGDGLGAVFAALAWFRLALRRPGTMFFRQPKILRRRACRAKKDLANTANPANGGTQPAHAAAPSPRSKHDRRDGLATAGGQRMTAKTAQATTAAATAQATRTTPPTTRPDNL